MRAVDNEASGIPSRELTVEQRQDESGERAMARTLAQPSVQASITLAEIYEGIGEVELDPLINELGDQIAAVGDDDLKRSEAMLVAQAHTLDALFNSLTRRAINSGYMNNLDRYLKLALRAQSQSRSTWETLMRLKNPPIAGYVGQANIAHGPQQVNNCSQVGAVNETSESSFVQNKLLDDDNGKWLDSGEAGATGSADQGMATVGVLDGTQDRGRQSPSLT